MQPAERRFVMYPALDAVEEQLNLAIDAEETARIAGDALKVAKAGDTMTGALVLPADPTLALQAATKQYVDNSVATGTTSGSRTIYVKAGMALTKGQPVYISSANGTNVIVSAAGNGSEATSSKTIGLVNSTLANNGFGYVTTNGLLSGLDTSGATAEGDAVWLGPSGTLLYGLAAKPVAPAHLVYIGIVTKKNASTGEILINPQNGFELDELHNVLITSPANGQALTYDSSSSLWKNATPISALSGLSDVTLTSPVTDQVLKYNGTKWINGSSGGGGVTASDTAPTSPSAGAAWFDTTDATLYVYENDGTSSQWVQVQANSALDASIQGRVGALESQAIALGTYSPNYIINGAFDFNQRGLTSTTNTGYGFDRWATYNSGGTTYSAQTFTPGAAPVAGYEGINFARIVTSGQSGTSAYTQLAQKVEDVRSLAGKTVTVSFWAKAASGTPKVSVELQQNFGTGGSPSSSVETYAGQVTLSTSWARYSITAGVPSISGKTIGTAVNSSFTQVSLWTSVGTDFNSRAGSIGIQSNTFDFWGVQLEQGSIATAFRRNSPNIQAELAACQRYYYRVTGASGIQLGTGIAFAGSGGFFNVPYAVTMRTTVSSIDTNGTFSYGNGVIAANFSTCTLEPGAQGTRSAFLRLEGSSGMTTGMTYRLDGNSTAYIGFNAEL